MATSSTKKSLRNAFIASVFVAVPTGAAMAEGDHHPETFVNDNMAVPAPEGVLWGARDHGAAADGLVLAQNADGAAPEIVEPSDDGVIDAEIEDTGEGAQIVLPEGGVIPLPDLTSHPLAGTEIEIEIEVYDGLNQTSRSQTVRVTLPEPFLSNPLNERLMDIRRELELNPEMAPELAEEMQQAMEEFAEELQNPETAEQLQDLQERMEQASPSDPQETDDIVDEMWEAMQQLEQDSLSEAEKRLNELREQLREAMENGAPQEEIDELMQQAQEAMEELLQEQAEAAAENGDDELQEQFERMQEMMQEMQEMMEQMDTPEQQQMSQEMMQQMMEQMQQMMQQQRMQQQGQQPQSQNQMSPQQMQQMMEQMQQMMQQMQEMQEMNDDLTELIEEQRALMEDTIEAADIQEADMPDIVEQITEMSEMLVERAQALDTADDEYTAMMQQQRDAERAALGDELAATDLSEEEKDLARAELEESYENEISNETSITSRLDDVLGDIERQHERVLEDLEQADGMNALEARAHSVVMQRYLRRLMILEMQHRERTGQDEEPPAQELPQQETGEPQGSPQDGPDQEMSTEELLERLQELMEREDEHRDRNDELQRQQNMRQSDLRRIIRQMERMGMDPGALSEALRAMDDAADELGRDRPREAVPFQGEAIQGLQEGQQQMQQQMQQMMQQGQQPGGGMPGGMGMPQPGGNIMDGTGMDGNSVNPNHQLGLTPEDGENRSRDIRDAIRQRLNEGDLTPDERRYLQDLLSGDADAPIVTRPERAVPTP